MYNRHGLGYNAKGDYDRAIADYTQALKLDSGSIEAYKNRALAYMNKSQQDKALATADFRQIMKLTPRVPGNS